jgi:hypothetical protein
VNTTRTAAAVRLLPGLALGALALTLLLRHAPAGAVLRYGAFVAIGITLPGLIVWRLVTRRAANLAEDLAAGFVTGTAALILSYLGCAALGLQRWGWLWAAPVLFLGAAVPAWRRIWWSRCARPLRPVTGWLLALAAAVPLLVVNQHGPERFTPAFTDPRVNYPDMPFHTALAASARYDVPLQAPWVQGEPMKYHYFFHQLVAATSWATGVELTDLIYALAWLPLLLAGGVLVFVLADRLVPRSAWAGPLAVLVAGVGGTLQPYPHVALAADMMATSQYLSPTQNLGVALAMLLCLVAVDLLTGLRSPARWALLALAALAASGSKATVLPLILCGFGLVFLVQLLHRRFDLRALAGGALAAVVTAGSVIVVFGGQSSGLAVRFARTFARMPPYQSLRTTSGLVVDPKAQLATAIVTLLAWAIAVAGLFVLLASRAAWRDNAVVFLAGFGISGFAALLLTDQPGNSELYFHRTALPAIAVLACAGLARLARRIPGAPWLVAASGAAGLAACGLSRALADGQVRRDAWALAAPWLATGAALLVAAAVVTLGWRLARRPGRPVLVFALALLTAGTVGATWVPVMALVTERGTGGKIFEVATPGGAGSTEATAARWLRDNSAPGDLVATNAHCAARPRGGCDARHFWIAALTERHVLVEGWAYTNTVNEIVARTGASANLLPFWDQPRLHANDEVFEHPSAAAVARLKDRYGVRWLYADTSYARVPAELNRFATLRYSRPGVRIYELR